MLLKKIKVRNKVKFIRQKRQGTTIPFCQNICKYYQSLECFGVGFCGKYIMSKDKSIPTRLVTYLYFIEQKKED